MTNFRDFVFFKVVWNNEKNILHFFLKIFNFPPEKNLKIKKKKSWNVKPSSFRAANHPYDHSYTYDLI